MAVKVKDLKNLPKAPIGDEKKQRMADYVESILNGMDRREAFKLVFPDLYQRAIDRSNGYEKFHKANILREINSLERNKYIKELFAVAEVNWHNRWMDKRVKICDKLFDIAMDSGEDTRDRINAGKAFMQHTANQNKSEKLEVTHKLEDDFKKKLLERKRELHNAANGDAIDVEVIDG